MSDQQVFFFTPSRRPVPGVSGDQLREAQQRTEREFGVSAEKRAEAASFSLAMVVRFALGLSASEGRVCAVVRDVFAGRVALACLRHLMNAGSAGLVVLHGEPGREPEHLAEELRTLKQLGAEFHEWQDAADHQFLTTVFGSCHNVMLGAFDLDRAPDQWDRLAASLLNELQTPIHCIGAPLGVDWETGGKSGEPLFASSTLSLGLPLRGLSVGSDYVGRHYLCDVSIPLAQYRQLFPACAPLFSDQPVTQIFSTDPGEAEG